MQTIERLWNITEALNVLYKENWTVMANMEMIKFQGEMVTALREEMAEGSCSGARDGEGEDFSLTTAFFYCLSLATTVGYEGGVPHTPLPAARARQRKSDRPKRPTERVSKPPTE